jgi:hypothetical protein
MKSQPRLGVSEGWSERAVSATEHDDLVRFFRFDSEPGLGDKAKHPFHRLPPDESDINSWVDSAQFLRSGGPAGAAHLTL